MGRYCSNACRRRRAPRVCVTCGDLFDVIASKATEETGKYCSVPCRGLARRNRVHRTCVVCDTAFERPASAAARAALLYCSRPCMTAAQRTDLAGAERVRRMQRAQLTARGTTKPERILYALLDDVVGPGRWSRQLLVFDRWTVDACLPELSLVIQADASYWHGFDPATHSHSHIAANMNNDKAQAAYLAKSGWHMLRLWEHELKGDPEACRARIADAVEKAR